MNQTTTAAAHWDQRYEQNQRSAWFANPLVLSELNRRITGSDTFWLTWLFETYLKKKPRHLLSIGCGDGSHENLIARQQWAKRVTGFDISAQGIAAADTVSRSENLNAHFITMDFDAFISNPMRDFDVVLFIGSLHHVKDLEGMLATVRQALDPGGIVIINEYCGPCFNIYDEARVALINSTLDTLDPVFKVSPNAKWINQSIDEILAQDPSESVRSSLIPSFMKHYFEPEITKPFGGALLHPLFDHLNGAKLADGSHESETIVRLLIQMENSLAAAGSLPNDFMFGVYKNTKHPSMRPT
ncbi:methyltransferase domain-containing protein [Agrobacterium vitis]|uniref:Methyltransferase domain-containing protein n=1 Tax=Agrobacterium vitis TaxID=373 RepID=A0A6L6VET3_AGRVI|nr:class I SAM-dependent methyltransferase [Agrobacterium vitis]MUZ73328.1 methyltransferase domain-containing protein [Agrobacterium vitis]